MLESGLLRMTAFCLKCVMHCTMHLRMKLEVSSRMAKRGRNVLRGLPHRGVPFMVKNVGETRGKQ